MSSTYSTSLKLQLMGNGDQPTTWGDTTNTNLNLVEQAIAGVITITMLNADYTLSNLNGVSDEARNMVLVVNGTNSAIRKVIAPLVDKVYIISNQTTGGYAINVGGSTGSYIAIPNGVTAQVYCDGTNFYSSQTGSAGDFNVNGNLAVNGTSTLTGATTVGNTLGVTGAQTNSSTLQATTITATTQFTGAGTGLSGTAASLITGGTKAYNSTNVIQFGWNGSRGTYKIDATDYGATWPIGISGNAATATSATTAGSTTSVTVGGNVSTSTVNASGWVYANTGGAGGDAMVLLRSSGSVGQVDAVNLSNNTYRWLQVGGGGSVLIGTGSPAFGASLTMGTLNGNGGIWCNSGGANQFGYGWAMPNGDGRLGVWNVGNGYLEVTIDGAAYGINIFASDENVKKNIAPTTYNATDVVNKIEFKEFDYDKEKTFRSDHVKCGITSQQIQTIDPDLARKVGDLLQPDESRLLMLALKGLQEANARIAALEAQLAK